MTDRAELVGRLIYESEGEALDVKRDQYPFSGATEDQKAELLKDILSFTNAWRHSDAYILIGVEELKPPPHRIVGISADLEDAALQQFVNSKTDQPIRFSYSTCKIQGAKVGVLEIPLQERPRFLKEKYGRLEAKTVYLRRGSSTAIAEPDEIARMGTNPQTASPDLDVQFADTETGELVGVSITGQLELLDIGEINALPDFEPPPEKAPFLMSSSRPNSDYFRELAEYTIAARSSVKLLVGIRNEGSVVAKDVRILLRSRREGTQIYDAQSFPRVPRTENPDPLSSLRAPRPEPPMLRVSERGGKWEILAAVEKVQPGTTAVIRGRLYVGATENRTIRLEGMVSADNIPRPRQITLEIQCTTTARTIDLKELQRIEFERYLATPEAQAFAKATDAIGRSRQLKKFFGKMEGEER